MSAIATPAARSGSAARRGRSRVAARDPRLRRRPRRLAVAAARVLGVESYLLPRFSDVSQRALGQPRRARDAALDHVQGGARRASCSAARSRSSSALVLARWRPLGNALMPYMIAANAIPIIAFAPITNAWFGTLSPWSKIVIAAVLCFFPVLVNTLRGLTSVRPESIELMRSYAAPERRSSGASASRRRCRSSSRP